MSEATYRISFTPRPGSLGTQVDYRIQNGSWITPSAPANPTSLSYYDLSLTKGETYDIRLSSTGTNCSPKYKYISIHVPLTNYCCPSGYTLSPEQDYCYKVEEIPATPPTDPQPAVHITNNLYSICGTVIFDPGYTLNGDGTYSTISSSNSFWINTLGSPCTTATTTDGPLNRNGVWTSSSYDGQTVGFSTCIEIATSKTYYVGFGHDNYGIIKIDGVEVLHTNDSTAVDGLQTWTIYPVELTSGQHFIEVIGVNQVIGGGPNPAVIGIEIYDNTAAEITAATSYSDLNIVFKSADYIGQPVQIGSDGFGYSCPAGYSLSCSPPYVCKRIVTESTFSC